jgi:DNA-binding CsgD family transcriptional regulator
MLVWQGKGNIARQSGEGPAMANAAARAATRIKQLSCLGLGGEAVMPALFQELSALFPYYSSSFFFSDENGETSNVYQENLPGKTLELHIEEFHNRREKAVSLGFTWQMRNCLGVYGPERVLTVDRSTFEKSDLYNLVLRELGCHDFMRIVVRDLGRPLGNLCFMRPKGSIPFSAEDRRRLGTFEPFIAHAITERPKTDWRLVDSGISTLIIADSEGRLIHSTAEGRRLLNLASYPWITRGAPPRFALSLPPALIRICRDLAGIFRNKAASSPPVHRHRNALGAFTFRAYWLEADDPAGLIGITISHEEPLPVVIMRRTKDLALSRRQAQVCFLLANRLTYEQIARELGVSKHTVIAHSRWIYNKLDVHNHSELTARLLCD